MKTRSLTLAIAALALWLIPSGALAQGRSGRERLTICHVPPGNPDARHTMTLSETAWGAHESHGDTLGPCDGYGGEEKQAKQAGKKKGRKRDRAGADEDRGSGEDFGERDSRGERDEIEDADRRSGRRTERRQRPARHRERRSRAGSEARSPAADESDITDRAVPGNEVDDGDSSAAASAIEAASQPITRDLDPAERRERNRTSDAQPDDTALP